jgi:type VII secretion-associated protein (TIGR03931 family)
LDTGTVRAHVIEVGPNAVRRLCCGGGTVADAEAERAAFESIDDHLALVDLQPVVVASLWEDVLVSIDCGTSDHVTVVHPSWWSAVRVGVVSSAARILVGTEQIRTRSWLLSQASPSKSERDTLVVEIADHLVVLTGAAIAAETRRRDQLEVVGSVTRSVLTMASDSTETVVIDAPATVHGARTLAASIAERLRGSCGMNVVLVDDIRMRRLAGELRCRDQGRLDTDPHPSSGGDGRRRALAMLVFVIGVIISVVAVQQRQGEPHAHAHLPTTFAVEGHVALEVPAQWPMRRVVSGPGSARLQITSPADPEVALHVTQSRVALSSLDATAEFLKSAIDAAPAGVFVDFNPSDPSAGHPAVTYREVRAGHDIRWAVWVDKAVRISIGCQSRSGRGEDVRQECDLAVRSARVLD